MRASAKQQLVLQLRQLLFEQRVVSIWLGHERVALAVALIRWRAWPGHAPDPVNALRQQLEDARSHWSEELCRERALSLKRAERDALVVNRLQGQLDEAHRAAARLRADNQQLRAEIVWRERQQDEAEEEQRRHQLHQHEAEARVAQQEATVRAQLEVEQLRLRDSSEQLAALEQAADEAEMRLLEGQREEQRVAEANWAAAASALRADRSSRSAWHAVRTNVRLRSLSARHAAQRQALEAERAELQVLHEGHAALEWRVTETRAQLILFQAAEGGGDVGATDDRPTATPPPAPPALLQLRAEHDY